MNSSDLLEQLLRAGQASAAQRGGADMASQDPLGGLGGLLGGLMGGGGPNAGLGGLLGGILGGGASTTKGGRQRMSTGEMIIRSATQSAARSIGTQISRAILRGVLGGISRK